MQMLAIRVGKQGYVELCNMESREQADRIDLGQRQPMDYVLCDVHEKEKADI